MSEALPSRSTTTPPTSFSGPPNTYDKEKTFAEYKPVEGVKVFGKNIIHTHAKDAKVFPEGRREVPLGEGWIDWPLYVSYLREIGYDGYFAIEREVGENPKADITKAINYLKTL